jgi:hypothetical protein
VQRRDAGVPDLDWKRWVPLDGPSWPHRGKKEEEHSGSCHLQSGCHGQNKEVIRQVLDLVVGPLDLAVIELDKLAGCSMWWRQSLLMVVLEAGLPGLRPTSLTSSPTSSLGNLAGGRRIKLERRRVGRLGSWFFNRWSNGFSDVPKQFFCMYHGFLSITPSSNIISRD